MRELGILGFVGTTQRQIVVLDRQQLADLDRLNSRVGAKALRRSLTRKPRSRGLRYARKHGSVASGDRRTIATETIVQPV